jgi:Spy/CpxP family protein refolding chaperone
MMTEEARRAFGLDNSQLLKWRKGGRSQKAQTLLFVAGVLAMILLGIKMLSSAPLPQYGGQQMRPQWGPEQQLARMTKQLNLTEDQQAKIKPILEDQHKQMMGLREDSSLSREQRRAKFQEIRKQTFEKMNPILTSEQQKQLQEMQQMRHEGRGRGRWNQPPAAN